MLSRTDFYNNGNTSYKCDYDSKTRTRISETSFLEDGVTKSWETKYDLKTGNKQSSVKFRDDGVTAETTTIYDSKTGEATKYEYFKDGKTVKTQSQYDADGKLISEVTLGEWSWETNADGIKYWDFIPSSKKHSESFRDPITEKLIEVFYNSDGITPKQKFFYESDTKSSGYVEYYDRNGQLLNRDTFNYFAE